MPNDDGPLWLTYREAARRVRRSERNVRRWQAAGMVMEWRTGDDGQRERVVREDVLLAWWRDRMQASPVHQNRVRVLLRESDPDAAEVPARPVKRDQGPQVAAGYRGGLSSASDERTALDGGGTAAPFDPLANMKPIRGEAEWAELQHALAQAPTPCRGDDAYTAERVDEGTRARLAAVCRSCHAVDACAAFAAANRPGSGYWPEASSSLAALG